MSFLSFMRQIFSLKGVDEAELEKYRVKHGIILDEKDTTAREVKNKPGAADYDVWEDIRNIRTNFFLGNWATKKFRPIGEEKVKKQLEELAKKREEEEERKKRGEGGL